MIMQIAYWCPTAFFYEYAIDGVGKQYTPANLSRAFDIETTPNLSIIIIHI